MGRHGRHSVIQCASTFSLAPALQYLVKGRLKEGVEGGRASCIRRVLAAPAVESITASGDSERLVR
jgi:hypothetical protein